MQISKVYKKRLVSALVLLAMLAGAGYIMGELLKPHHLYATDLYNAEFKEMKENKTDVDMVFIGASRVLVAFNPKIFEEKLSLNKVFNLSISQQGAAENYYQLKDFIQEFHPKTVILGITHTGIITKTTPRIVKLRMLERLHGRNRLSYIKNNLSVKEYPDILPLYGYRGNLQKIRQNVKDWLGLQKQPAAGTVSTWKYNGQGFLTNTQSIPSGNMGIRRNQNFNKTMVLNRTLYYLDQCVRLCKENNIQLIFVTPPTTAANMYEINSYQGVIDYISDYAKRNNIIYHNLSYLKNKEELLPDTMYYDFKHINRAGSSVISEKYAEILSRCLRNRDTGDSFYASFAEMQKSVHRIVAVDARPVIKNNMMTLPVQSLQNKGIVPSYQVLLAKTKNDFKPVVEWTGKKNVSFPVPAGRQYRVLLRARQNANDRNYAWMAWEVDKKGKIRKVQNVPVNGV